MTKLLNYLAPAAILMALALTGCSGSKDRYERPPMQVVVSVPAGQGGTGVVAIGTGQRWVDVLAGGSVRFQYYVNPGIDFDRVTWKAIPPEGFPASLASISSTGVIEPNPAGVPNAAKTGYVTVSLGTLWNSLLPAGADYPVLLFGEDSKTGLGVVQWSIYAVSTGAPPAEGEELPEPGVQLPPPFTTK